MVYRSATNGDERLNASAYRNMGTFLKASVGKEGFNSRAPNCRRGVFTTTSAAVLRRARATYAVIAADLNSEASYVRVCSVHILWSLCNVFARARARARARVCVCDRRVCGLGCCCARADHRVALNPKP